MRTSPGRSRCARAAIDAAVLACALGACAPEARSVTLSLALPDALGCRPTAVTALRVTPLGDFPSEARPIVSIDPAGGAQAIDAFPLGTTWVAIEADGVMPGAGGTMAWRGGGVARLEEGDALRVPLLRFGRACALSDEAARAPDGAVVLALDDGRLVIAGGLDADAASAAVVTVRPGDRLAERSALRLFTPRLAASGTRLSDDRVLIAGGAVGDPGAVLDSVELLRLTQSDPARVGEGFLARARRDHAAARIDDAIVIAGGRDDRGAVAEVERLVVDETITSVGAGRATPRWGARFLALDDGTHLLVGGQDDDGPSGVVERWEDGALVRAPSMAPREDAAFVALPGARAARIGGRDDGGWSREVELLLDRGSTTLALGEVLPPIEVPVALALVDGRVLVVGRDPDDGRASAVVFDPGGARPSSAVEPSRVATHLVALRDGTIAVADDAGLSLLRLDLTTPFSDPSASLFPAQPEQRAALAIDAVARWRTEGDRFVAAVDGARVDLPAARFADVRVELDVEGEGELLFTRDGAPPHALRLAREHVALGECRAARATPVIVERLGDTLRVGDATCPLDEPARLGLAVRLDAGAGLRRLSVTRL